MKSLLAQLASPDEREVLYALDLLSNGRVDFAEIDVCTIVDEVISGASQVAAQRKIALAFPTNEKANVRGERFLLAQAIGNLVHNALEFSPEGAAVTITVRTDPARATVSRVPASWVPELRWGSKTSGSGAAATASI